MVLRLIEWKTRLLVMFLIGLILVSSGCDDVNKTRQILQDGINELDKQPGLWQTTMLNTINELNREGTSSAKEVLADVQSIYNNALGQTESATFCGTDFFARRLKQRMQAILQKLDKNTSAPEIVPVVCTTNPGDHIDAGPNPPKTLEVIYYGYDFQEFNKTKPFVSDLEYGSGQIVQKLGWVRISTNYKLSVDIQAADYTNVDRSQGPALVLKWSGQKVLEESARLRSELPIIIPTPKPPDEYDEIQEEMDVYLKGNHCDGIFGPCAHQDFNVIKYPPLGYIVDQTKGDPEHKGLTLISDNTHSYTRKPENHQINYEILPANARVYGWIKGQEGAWGQGVGGYIDMKFTVYYRSIKPKNS